MKNLTKLIITALLSVVLVPLAGTSANAAIPTAPLYVGGIGADTKIIANVYYGVIDEMPSSITFEAALANNDGSATISSCTVAVPTTRCTITGLTNGTSYYVRAFTSNNDGASSKVYGAWTVTPTSASVIYAAQYDCSVDVYRVQPCQLSGPTNATVYGQGLQECTSITAIGGGLPGGSPIAVTPSVDGTSAVIHITAGASGWAQFNCGLGNVSSFLGNNVSYLGESGFVPTWSQSSGEAGTVVELNSQLRNFVGITRLQLQGVDVSYSVVNPHRILITIPSGLTAGTANLTMDSLGGTGTLYNVWTVVSNEPSLSFSSSAVSPCETSILSLANINPIAKPAVYIDGVQAPLDLVFGWDTQINFTWEYLVESSGNYSGYLENDAVYTIRYISDEWNGTTPVPFSDPYLASASITMNAGYACGTEPGLGFGSISPSTGSIAGGTQVTITGTAFDESTGVSIGGEFCQIVSRTATQIVCLTPAGSVGSADIVIMSEGADTVTVSGAFTYVAPQTVFAPQRPTASQATVVVGPGSLKVTMAYDGVNGFKPSGYTAHVKPGGNSCVIATGATSCEIIGLTAGVEYELVITAVNQAGISPSLVMPNKYLIGEKSPLKLYKKLTIRPFAGDSAKLTNAFKSQLRKFVSASPKLTAFTCTGYTAGTPVKSSDKALAKARAKAVCGYLQKLNPEATTTVIGLTPGLSWSANNRKVLVKGYGLEG